MLSVSVFDSCFDSCCNKSLLPRTIYELKDECLSLQDFYDSVKSDVERNNLLKEARVGKSKEELDAISDLSELSSKTDSKTKFSNKSTRTE